MTIPGASTIGSAVALEVEWLRSGGDGLPALLASAGGPWDIVQGYATRTPPTKKKALYLVRRSVSEVRFSQQRKIIRHQFRGRMWWPVGATSTAVNLREDEQQAFDNAVELLVARVRGTVSDHSHGARFLSVAETPAGSAITVDFADPFLALSGGATCLNADIAYSADSADFTA